jgi:hypothetical protein
VPAAPGAQGTSVAAARGSGMRTRSSSDAAAPGLHGRAAAAAGREGDDGCDSDHSMRSTGSHRRKALAPHRAGL